MVSWNVEPVSRNYTDALASLDEGSCLGYALLALCDPTGRNGNCNI